MVYIPPINNKLGPTEAPMASKNLGSKTIGSSIQSFFLDQCLNVDPTGPNFFV